MRSLNKSVVLLLITLFQSLSFSDSIYFETNSDYTACYEKSVEFLTQRPLDSIDQSGDKILTQIKGKGNSEYDKSVRDCLFTVTEDARKLVTISLELTKNGTLDEGKTTHMSRERTNDIESYSLSCKGSKRNILMIESTIQQKGGWRKTFQNKIEVTKDEQGTISKVKMDTDGPFNTAGKVSCKF